MAAKGSVLISTLWLLALFALFIASFSFRVRLETKMTGQSLLAQQSREDLESAAQYARHLLESDLKKESDSPNDRWYGSHTPAGWTDNENIRVEIQDEESKLNINYASPVIIRRFLSLLKEKGYGLRASAEDLASSITRWRGESAAFGKPSTFPQKNSLYESREELLLIEDMDAEDYKILRPFLTVYAQPGTRALKININTAHPLLLQALIAELPGDSFAKDAFSKLLAQYLEQAAKGAVPFFSEESLNPGNFSQLCQLPNTAQMTSLVQQFLSYMTVNSQFFQVSAYNTASDIYPSRATAIIGPSTSRLFSQSMGTVAGTGFFRESDIMEILQWQEK